jgi:hypothetical protein
VGIWKLSFHFPPKIQQTDGKNRKNKQMSKRRNGRGAWIMENWEGANGPEWIIAI